MSVWLDTAALLVLLSGVSFGFSGMIALPLLRELAQKHGLPRRTALVALIPFLGLPILFALFLRTGVQR